MNAMSRAQRRDVTEVAGLPVQSFTEASLVATIMAWAAGDEPHLAVGVNAALCHLARHERGINDFLRGHTMYADGQSVVWATALLGGPRGERLATTDIAIPVLEAAAAAGYPVYFFGAQPGVAEAACEKMRARVPGLNIRSQHGYVTPQQMDVVLRDIAQHGTRILFVGLGDPLQQRWVAERLEALPPAVLTCGGLFDWLSESKPRAPKWMIRGGLEWLWRCRLEPRRLLGRYVVTNVTFVVAVARQLPKAIWPARRPRSAS